MAMVTGEPVVLAPEALAALKAMLRIVRDDEDALLRAEIDSALALCERFTGQALIQRAHRETLPVAPGWQRLTARPVRAITGATGIAADLSSFALPVDAYGFDIEADGTGRIRVLSPGSASRIEIAYLAGLAADWTALPPPLRQGVLCLAAHGHAVRDRVEPVPPPAAVTALWRPWRLLRLV